MFDDTFQLFHAYLAITIIIFLNTQVGKYLFVFSKSLPILFILYIIYLKIYNRICIILRCIKQKQPNAQTNKFSLRTIGYLKTNKT